MAGGIESKLRVFLSADLVGSTKLKNRLNHQELLDKYLSRGHVIEKLRKQDGALAIPVEIERAAVLESLAVSTDDFDWATVVCAFYEGIHTEFVTALEDQREAGEIDKTFSVGIKPWKAVGDELIYEVHVNGRRELYQVTTAFLRAIRVMDGKIGNRPGGATKGLRIKGAGWVAGFPVRNREIKLPPDDRSDFLGPEMDTGFRIAKCTRAGMLVVCVEMAELLGESQATFADMLGKIVGWEKLQGVWNDQRYPVIWIDFPGSHPAANAHPAPAFSMWDREDCQWCKTWSDESKPKQQLSKLAETLRELRDALPKSLGLVDPYILDDRLESRGPPPEHLQILDLLNAIEAHRTEANRQDAEETARDGDPIENDVAQVADLVKRAAKQSPGIEAQPAQSDRDESDAHTQGR